MKKHFLKSFALIAMLFSAITMSAKQYCGEVMKSNIGWDGNYTLSVEKVSNTQSRLTIIVADSETITGFYQFLIQNQGGGTASKQNFDPNDADFSNAELFSVAADGKSAVINVNWTTYPSSDVQIHLILRRNNSAGGSDIFGNNLTDVDFSAACGETPGEGGEEPEPTPDPEDPEVTDKWADVDWVAASDNKYKIYSECLTQVVSVQQPGWANEKGIYVTVPAGISECSVNGAIDGAGMILYLSSFTAKETEVTITHGLGSCTFWVYYADGISGLLASDLTITAPTSETLTLSTGDTYTINHTTSSVGAITYESSNTSVAEVSNKGVITAKSVGTALITVKQAASATHQAGMKKFNVEIAAVPLPSNKGFGTYQGRVDLYDWIGDYAGNNACGQVDLYVVTWGNDILFKAKAVEAKFEGGEYMAQLRTRNADLSDGIRETWGRAIADDGATRYSEYGNLNQNYVGLVGYGETFKMWSYMVIAGCGARTMKTLTYTRDHINNPISDNTAPALSGAANVTSTAENVTIALPAVTSEEVFYMIKDEAHNKQYVSLTPAFVLPQDGSGITYTYSCYAVDFNGNMSNPLTVEVSLAFKATSNLALNKPSQAGYSINDNMLASKANDGDINSRWSSEQGNNPTDAWWYVDLGESYNLSTIEISWQDAFASDYVIIGSDLYINPTDASAWQSATLLISKTEEPTAVGNNTQEIYSVTGNHARYIRFQANTLRNNGWGCSFWEFRVFGTGVYDPSAAADTEKPVITSATPKTPIAHNEVQITMEASDNVGVVSYEVKDDAKGVSATCVPVDNVITVSNLQEQTTYNLSIVAVDAVGNKSDAYAMAAFTTGVNPYVPHESAPVPNRDAEDVLAFYSDTYTPVINWGSKKDWNGVGTVTENAISANNYLMYKDVTWWGWTYGVKDGYTNGTLTGVDCSNMEYLHIDVWGPIDGKIRVIPIYGGGVPNNENYYAEVTIKAGQWNSVDVALAEFEGAGDKHDFSSIYQIKFAELNIETVSIDNVYFYKVDSITTSVENTQVEVQSHKLIRNGVLYIIRNGVTYDVMGRVVR